MLFKTSKTCEKQEVFEAHQRQTPYEINVRATSFVREIGLGLNALQTFSKCMNSPSPTSRCLYDNIFEKYLQATKEVAITSMQRAAEELIEKQNGERDAMVSVDGTWQRRGYNSHNGVVTAVSVLTGKALDIEVLSNYCKGCSQWKEDQKKSAEYQQWLTFHKCHLNHEGSAGAMEPEGAIKIFARSDSERNLRYTEYLGDGDSSSFLKVKENKPYGEDIIKKSECVGHIQKRMGSRLRKLCTAYKEKLYTAYNS